MRLFLDTNVLVSAFAARGLCADLLEVVLLEHELATGRAVLRELEKVLRAKVKLAAERCAEIVDYVSSESIIVVEDASPAACEADEGDRLVLGEGLTANADAFVTGGFRLLGLRAIEDMQIIAPRQLWDLLRK